MSKRRRSRREKSFTEPAVQPPRKEPDWLPAVIIGAGILVYINSFSGTFVLDDLAHIVYNDKIKQLSPVSKFLLHDRRPLVTLSLAINYALGGVAKTGKPYTWGFHLFNLTVHIAAALTLFGVVRRTLLSPRFKERYANSAAWLGFAVALIWVVHPLQTQSVTYIVQRAESMMGLFYLLTLYCFIRGGLSERGFFWYVATCIACALGMSCKAVMVTAPAMVLIYDWVFLSGSLLTALRRRWPLYCGLALSWLLLLNTGVVQGALNPSHKGTAAIGFAVKDMTPLEYLLTQPGVMLHYLKLSLWPHPLNLDYAWPIAHGAGAIVPAAVVILFLVVVSMWGLLRRSWWGFAGAWFFIVLSPTSSFVPIKDVAFEHRMYLPLAAVIVLAVMLVYRLLAGMLRSLPEHSSFRAAFMGGVLVLVAAPLCYGTLRRNPTYHDAIEMYKDVISKAPHNARAFNNLGTMYRERARPGDAENAVNAYEGALKADSQFGSALHNLGALYEQTGRLNEAVEYFRRARDAQPEYSHRHANYAKTLVKLGRFKEAIEEFEEALRIDPKNATARIQLGATFMKMSQVDKAIEQYYEAVQADPNYTEGWNQLGLALIGEERFEEAVSAFRKAVELEPDHPSARVDLGASLMKLGRLDEAIEQFRETLKHHPDHVDAYYNLGRALQSQGKLEEAAESYRKAIELKKDHADAWTNLGVITRQLGQIDEALDCYLQALDADRNHVNARYNYAVGLHEQGRLAEAIEQYEALLSIAPGFGNAKELLDRARRELREKKKRQGGTQP